MGARKGQHRIKTNSETACSRPHEAAPIRSARDPDRVQLGSSRRPSSMIEVAAPASMPTVSLGQDTPSSAGREATVRLDERRSSGAPFLTGAPDQLDRPRSEGASHMHRTRNARHHRPPSRDRPSLGLARAARRATPSSRNAAPTSTDLRWPGGVECPRCSESTRASSGSRRAPSGTATSCRYQFSVTAGTLFHSSHLPVWKWFVAVHLMLASPSGLSANELRRVIGGSYKTAWFAAHRIRAAMSGHGADLLRDLVDAELKRGRRRDAAAPGPSSTGRARTSSPRCAASSVPRTTS